MKQISASLTSKLRENSIIERDYIVFSGETEKHYLWFNLYDDCYKDGNFIGTFILKRLELTYNDSDLEFKNKEFNAYKEYKLNDGTWESINYGTFIVTAVEESDTKEEIKVTAYDYGLKFANPYVSGLDYASGTVTLMQVIQEVCENVGVELENTTLENGGFIVDSNQFDGNSQFGNVVSAVAGISCNFAKITAENKLKFIFRNETDVIIEASDYEEFEDKRDTHPYNAVSIGMSDVEGENVTMVDPSVEPGKENYFTLNDNPFAYTEVKRGELIEAIFNKINGFGYSSFVLKKTNYPQLECGDLVKIRNKNGELVDSIVLRPSFEEIEITIEAPSIINATVKYQNPPSAYDIAKRTEITVDKQNQTITSLVTTTTTIEGNLNNLETSVENNYQEITENFDNYVAQSDFIQYTEQVKEEMTNTYKKIEIDQMLTDGTVSMVKTTTGTFDANGLTVDSNTSQVKNLLAPNGMTITDKTGSTDSELLFAGYDEELHETIVRSKNITVQKYLTVAGNSRIEAYSTGAGIFWVGD